MLLRVTSTKCPYQSGSERVFTVNPARYRSRF